MKYGNRPRWKKVVSSPASILFLLIVLALVGRAAWSIRQKSILSQTKLDEAKAGLVKLQERDADLSQKVAYLSTDEGVEAELRSKYHAVNEGESVAVILDDPGSQTADAQATTASSSVPLGWWGSFLRMFGL